MKYAKSLLLFGVACFTSCDKGAQDYGKVIDDSEPEQIDPFERDDTPELSVHPDFQEEGMTAFFAGRWRGGAESPDSYFEYNLDGTCSFQFDAFYYSGTIAYEPGRMTTWFKKGGRDYVIIISPSTSGDGTQRVDGIAEVFIGYDPKPRFRERALDLTIYKKKENKSEMATPRKPSD